MKQRLYGQKELPKDSTDGSGLLPVSSSLTVAMDTTMSVLYAKKHASYIMMLSLIAS